MSVNLPSVFSVEGKDTCPGKRYVPSSFLSAEGKEEGKYGDDFMRVVVTEQQIPFGELKKNGTAFQVRAPAETKALGPG